ncbi:unnamed protein product [Caretta caretta]
MYCGSRFFYALEKRGGAKKHVTCLLEEDSTPLMDLVEMRAVLTLLPKKGDICDLWNWRPVSLLSTDYKVVAKAILLQLGSVLVDLVNPDSGGGLRRTMLSMDLDAIVLCQQFQKCLEQEWRRF